MKYFLDTEFIEGSQTKRLLSIPIGKTKPTIDLISIGIVAEDGREYYAISKDFNLKEAWNRWEYNTNKDTCDIVKKVYWIRDNVLKPIFNEMTMWDRGDDKHSYFTYKNFKYLLNKYGKTNKQIAEEIKEFVYKPFYNDNSDNIEWVGNKPLNIEFYGYYSDYDWVVFCWLFGKMIDLPKGFPMYCIDLKQELDNKANQKIIEWGDNAKNFDIINHIKTLPNYPKQTNDHNALADVRWNKELYTFLNNL